VYEGERDVGKLLVLEFTVLRHWCIDNVGVALPRSKYGLGRA
jgi:hypothetical protein